MNEENKEIGTEDAPAEVAEESADQIRADIEETRASMSETIDAIQEKLSPEHIKEQVKEKVHDATIGRAQDLAHAVAEKLNPAAEKLNPAAEKVGEATKQVEHSAATFSTSAHAKLKNLKKWARSNPFTAGSAALALLLASGACVFVARRKN